MAGKAKTKKCNDKFYFVLDEVGESDDDKSDENLPNIKESIPEPANNPISLKIPEKTLVESEASNLGSHDVVDMDVESEDEIPLIKISFRNTEVAYKYGDCIISSLMRLLPKNINIKETGSLTEAEFWEDKKDVFFVVDNVPTDGYDTEERIPLYSSGDMALKEPGEISKNNSSRRGGNCFNCEGSHGIRDCPHPKNFTVINKNRLAFQSRNQSKGPSRYHLDENQKFSHIKPGELSSDLRNALGLRKEQLPRFIYKMRELGYPPGWLEEAKVSHSGVTLYGEGGQSILEDDEEEGEIITDGAKDKIDINKIIDFPGFNVLPTFKYKEEHNNYNCPPMLPEFSKETMLTQMEASAVKAYKKKKLEPASVSPSIEEMEKKKQELLLELDDEDKTEDKVEDVKTVKPVKVVREVSLGTPILQSVSPYSRIPSREKFSVNICDVINFENLPNSTGKYDQMADLITKIRKVKETNEVD